ncbi:MAG: acyltransferase [Bacteroidota bacterium]
MRKLFNILLVLKYRWNGLLVKLFLTALGCKVGRGLKCLKLPSFKDIPSRNMVIGNNVSIGQGVIFEIANSGSLKIGDRCTLGDYTRYSTIDKITIGNAVAIAEQVSIRGSFHHTNRYQKIIDQGDHGEPILIGDDVLLGSQVVVLMGSTISEGAVIGAKSLVLKSDKVHPYGIFAGSPLKHIRDRK